MIFGALYFARLDIYMFPGELKPLDWGSVSFNSMVYLEHKYNNPIAVVFRENLRREIQMVLPPEKQAIKNLQNKFKQAILLHQNETLQRQTKIFLNVINKEKVDFIQRTKDEISLKHVKQIEEFKDFKTLKKTKRIKRI